MFDFGIGIGELVLILILALLLIEPKKLPELARSLGNAVSQFYHGKREVDSKTVEKREKEELRIRKLAEKIGVNVEGKSIEALLDEIEERIEEPLKWRVKG